MPHGEKQAIKLAEADLDLGIVAASKVTVVIARYLPLIHDLFYENISTAHCPVPICNFIDSLLESILLKYVSFQNSY